MTRRTYTIDDCARFAQEKGGRCLSKLYKNSTTKMKWICKFGHIWEATFSPMILKGVWCPECAHEKNAKLRTGNIDKLKEAALKNGGKLLSRKYKNANTKYNWECKRGHRWWATAGSVVNGGTWCPRCQGRNKTIQELKQKCRERGGRCHSKTLSRGKQICQFSCAKGHKWSTSAEQVFHGIWCPYCAGKRKDIKTLQQIARDRGGECLSTKYEKCNTKYEFRCANNHIFKSPGNSIEQGSWCPECTDSYGERITRVTFEYLYKTSFKKTRPKWLVNDRGNQMELDGYSPAFKLAFEHQGKQHSRAGAFGCSEKELEIRKKDDRKKIRLCKKEGITLIQVPELIHQMKVIELVPFLQGLADTKVIPKFKSKDQVIPLHKAYKIEHKEIMNEYSRLARSLGFKLHKSPYLGVVHKYDFTCTKGHSFKRSLDHLKTGQGCPRCRGYYQTTDDMHKLAASNGGKFLSKKLGRIGEKHKWQCDKGHEWEAAPSTIKSGHWCSVCNRGKTRTIKDLIEHASRKKGKCLSKKWVGAKGYYKFECQEGHQWSATANKIINRGSWCRICADKKRGEQRRKETLEKIKMLATEHYLKCTSKEFSGKNGELSFVCKKKHRFKKKYYTFLKNPDCPKCVS